MSNFRHDIQEKINQGDTLTVEDLLDSVDLKFDGYIPSTVAFEFFSFIRLALGEEPENANPLAHYFLIDTIFQQDNVEHYYNLRGIDYQKLKGQTAILCCREFSKSTLIGTFLPLFIAWKGKIPGYGKVNYGLYVGDSMRNNVKTTMNTIEKVFLESEWLLDQFEAYRFTDEVMELVRHPRTPKEIAEYQRAIDMGKKKDQVPGRSKRQFSMKGVGAQTGTRGTRSGLHRPQFAIFDDLVPSEADANSDAVLDSIETTIDSDVLKALHGGGSFAMIIGTPYNKKDPVYSRIESGAWVPVVFPICKEIRHDLTEEEFEGVWEDRHSYANVMRRYIQDLRSGSEKLKSFMQELMLRINTGESKLIDADDIVWYERATVLANKSKYNFYITTDFATSEKKSSDYSVISVWAYNNNGDWLWVDGTCKRQNMNENITELFRYVSMYKPQSVGVEVTGQQGGFIDWIQQQMIDKNIFFTLAQEDGKSKPGFRPSTGKLERFNTVVPLFKNKKIWFPKGMDKHPAISEMKEELLNVGRGGFKSKHDDFADTVSMLSLMKPWKPSEEVQYKHDDGIWEEVEYEEESKNSLIF